MADFSLALNDDQIQLKDWIHDFAKNVVRPAAEEWDEREEFPWPIVEEAARIGLYSLDFWATQAFDRSGLGTPVALEELFWGDAGIGLAIVGSALAAAALRANGTDEQVGEWAPQMFGTSDRPRLASFCSSEADAGSDVGAMRTRAAYDQARDEWVLNGTKTWATNGGIADIHVVTAVVEPELGSRGQASFLIPPGTPGLAQGQKFAKHGIRASHTAEVVLNTYDRRSLTDILRRFGEEKFASRIAGMIVERRERTPFTRTGDLVALIYDAIPAPARRTGGHPAKRTFQALRIAVNAELDSLTAALPAALAALRPGGRLVVMAYQSLEDRIVKTTFAAATASGTPPGLPMDLPGHEPKFTALTRGAERASEAEIGSNPRSAPVRLRAVERVVPLESNREGTR